MTDEMTFFSALVVGLVSGSTHCPAMCGGIVAALSMGSITPGTTSTRQVLPFVLAYNLGRISSYVIAGMLAGGLGQLLASHLVEMHTARQVLFMIAAVFMFLLGLYISGWWRGLAKLEALGVYPWKYIEPLGRRFLPVRNIPQAYLLGIFWGWLPCGLVYTALVWSLSSGGVFAGASLMLGFGLGTLPLMLAMGLGAGGLVRRMQRYGFRRVAGVLLMLFALVMLLQVTGLWQ